MRFAGEIVSDVGWSAMQDGMSPNVASVLEEAARAHPERIACVDASTGESFTYGELLASARSAASALASMGVRSGDRVGLMGANGQPFLSAWFGALEAGAVLIPIPILSAVPEVRFRMQHAGGVRLLADAERLDLGRAAIDPARVTPLESCAAPQTAEAGRGLREPHGASTGGLPDEATPEDAMLLYTSGTTGAPKGARISHRSLLAHTRGLVDETLALTPNDRVLCVLPWTHSYGIRMTVLAPMMAGAQVVMLPRFSAAASLDAIEAHGVTWVPGVPTMFNAWGRDPGPPCEGVRWALSAGAPLTERVCLDAERRLGCSVRQGYGLTEATFTTIDAPPSPRTIGSVGKPVPGVRVRIVDAAGAVLPADRDGEVQVQGRNVMVGYLDDSAATRSVTATSPEGDWLRTGDVGRLDAQGRLALVDRTKDLILRGGVNVYPSEVENALAGHEEVAQVAVVGRADPYYGEEVVAVVVGRTAATDQQDLVLSLDRYVRERIAKNKVPRHYVFVDEMPLGPSGKVLKRELRRRIADGECEVLPARR